MPLRRFAILAASAAIACGGSAAHPVAASSPPPPSPPAEEPSAASAGAGGSIPPEPPSPGGAENGPPEPSDAPPLATTPSTRGWLGVELEAPGPGEGGARIGKVVPRSPADAAGLQTGDVIVRLDEQPVASPADVIGVVASRPAGSRIGVVLKRGTAPRLLPVTLGSYPERDQLYRMSFVDLPAPSFELLSTAKGTFTPTLSAQRGKVVVVEFWASWCVACRALIPHMNDLYSRYSARGLAVVGITADGTMQAATAASELGMEFPILSDETGKTMRAYDARAIPAVFVIDRRGTVRDVMVGYDRARVAQVDALVQRLLAER